MLFPGVYDTLAVIKRRKNAIGVVTSLPGRLANPILNALSLDTTFDVVIHAGNCRYRKPSPGPITAALSVMNIAPCSAFYVGDTDSDARAAAAAHTGFAWASYGYGTTCPPDAVPLRTFKDVLEL